MRNSTRTTAAVLALSAAVGSHAGTGFTLNGPALTTGGVSNGQSLLSLSANPAAVGFDRSRAKGDSHVLGGIYAGGGLEYGDAEELFDQYDALADALTDSGGFVNGLSFTAIDPNNPDFSALIAQINTEAQQVDTLLALVGQEGYANADLGFHGAFIINGDVFGGTLGFDLNYSGSASASSIIDPLAFDADAALTELDAAYTLTPGDPVTTFDLTGGISLNINPTTGAISGAFTNDSLLAVRAAEQTQLGMSYSYPITLSDNSRVYLGAKAKVVQLGLSRVMPRIGDITDSEALFDDISDADMKTTSNLSLDLGALWVSEHVSAGISVEDILEPEYKFNAIDTTGYSAAAAAAVARLGNYQQEAKVSIEASVYTADRTWALSSYVETQATTDAMGEEHQWLQISGGWHSDSFWLPNVRVGYRANQAGSEVSIYSFGVTLFRYLNVDVATATQKVTIEGESLPRGASASMGINFAF